MRTPIDADRSDGSTLGDVPDRAGGLLLLSGALLWGTTGTAQALGPASAASLSVGSTRLVVGGLLLAVWAGSAGGKQQADRGPPRAGLAGPLVPAALLGALAVAGYQLSFFAAVRSAGVALGTAVAIGSAPAFTGLLEWRLRGVRPSRRWWLATAISTAGVAILAGPSRIEGAGLVLALLAGLSYAGYALAGKHLLDHGVPSSHAMAWIFGLGGLLLLPVAVTSDLSWLGDPAGVAMLAWLGFATILVAYLLYGRGLARLSAATASTLSLAEPLTAAVLATLVLGERPTAAGAVGAVLIVGGLVITLVRIRPPGRLWWR